MGYVLLRRLAGVVITLLLASVLIFFAVRLGGGDPTTLLVGSTESLTPARIAEVRSQFGLDQSLLSQYFSWLGGVLHADFGLSYVYRLRVSTMVGSRLVSTLSLVVYATVLFVIIGVLLGAWSARRVGHTTDTVLTSLTTFLSSIPPFVLGLLLLIGLAVGLGWFPVGGGGQGFLGRIGHLTLPALALALGCTATISRVTRQSMVQQQTSDHLESAEANGLTQAQLVRRHVLRNSVMPIVTMSGLVFASLFAGTVVIEKVFSLSGIGSLLVDSINTNDYPVVQAVLLLMVLIYVVVTLLVDLVSPLIDPRLRSARRAPRASSDDGATASTTASGAGV